MPDPDFCTTSNSNGLSIGANNYTTPYISSGASGVTSTTGSPTSVCLPGSGSIASIGWLDTIPDGQTVNQATIPTRISQHLETLLTGFGARMPMSPQDRAQTDPTEYALNLRKLQTAINNEYCYYYKCYSYALPAFLTAVIANPSNADNKYVLTPASGTPGQDGYVAATYQSSDYLPGTVATLKQNCKNLNRILYQIVSMLQALATKNGSILNGYTNELSGLNGGGDGTLSSVREGLLKQMTLLQDANTGVDLKAAMIDYTNEKNSASRNMMALYGFLNIVAVGMLVYLYRSSK